MSTLKIDALDSPRSTLKIDALDRARSTLEIDVLDSPRSTLKNEFLVNTHPKSKLRRHTEFVFNF